MRHNKDKKDNSSYPLWEGSFNGLGMYTADPMGSYTGRPLDDDDIPVQDADDL